MNAKQTFDINLLHLRQKRAANRFALGKDKSPDFLLEYAAEELRTRLEIVNRHFDNAVDLFGRTGKIASALADMPRVSNVMRVENADFHVPDIQKNETGLSIKTGEAATLPLAEASADLIVSAFALHWSNDLPHSLIQIKKALRPDGLFLGLLPGPNTLKELRQCFAEAEIRLFGGNSPRIDPFITVQSAGALLQRAGFALPVIDTQTITVRYNKALDLMHDLRAMGATNILTSRESNRFSRALFTEVSQRYAEQFSDTDGRIRASFEFISLSGWAPHSSQQQPLKPGSAKINLSRVLGKTAQQEP